MRRAHLAGLATAAQALPPLAPAFALAPLAAATNVALRPIDQRSRALGVRRDFAPAFALTRACRSRSRRCATGCTASSARCAAAPVSIAGASAALADGERDLSTRTDARAGEPTRASGSMSRLTAIVSRDADGVNEANTPVDSVAGIVPRGGQAVGEIVATTSGIRESAGRTSRAWRWPPPPGPIS